MTLVGPGVEVFYAKNRAIRFEYLYRHLFNANTGPNNPGVDQGVIRLSLTERAADFLDITACIRDA